MEAVELSYKVVTIEDLKAIIAAEDKFRDKVSTNRLTKYLIIEYAKNCESILEMVMHLMFLEELK